MKFIGCFNKSVILTYIGMILSITGTFNLLINGSMDISIICLILAGICDLFDGAIARKCKRNDTQKKFGIQLDSLVDTFSFVIYPCILLFYLWKTTSIVYIFVSAIYIICGITRLAWFNSNVEDFKEKFQGLPVTYAALIIPILYLIFRKTMIMNLIMPIAYCLIAFLFILDFKMKKPKGKWYIIFGLLAIATITLILI